MGKGSVFRNNFFIEGTITEHITPRYSIFAILSAKVL